MEYIIEAVHEPINIVFCVDDATKRARAAQCVTRQVWKEAGEKLQAIFDSKTIGDLCKKARAIGLKKILMKLTTFFESEML